MIARYKRDSTGNGPKLAERLFYDNAGLAGGGGASYVDSVIARDDLPIDDGSGSGATLLSRTSVYLQNWRGDVVSLLDPVTGRPREQVRYSAYGRPFSIPAGDVNASGAVGSQDINDFLAFWFAQNGTPGTPLQRGDANYNGSVSVQDLFDFQTDWFNAGVGGRDVLAASGVTNVASPTNNRKGYAGYEQDTYLSSAAAAMGGTPANPGPQMQLARFRWYRADLGAWTQRDPIGYADGMNLYAYVGGRPIMGVDPSGLFQIQTGGGGGSGGGVSSTASEVTPWPPVNRPPQPYQCPNPIPTPSPAEWPPGTILPKLPPGFNPGLVTPLGPPSGFPPAQSHSLCEDYQAVQKCIADCPAKVRAAADAENATCLLAASFSKKACIANCPSPGDWGSTACVLGCETLDNAAQAFCWARLKQRRIGAMTWEHAACRASCHARHSYYVFGDLGCPPGWRALVPNPYAPPPGPNGITPADCPQ